MSDDEDIRSLPPSERAEKRRLNERLAKEQAEARESMLRHDFGLTFQTDHGKRVLAWLAERCGWALPPLAANKNGEIDEKITTHNAMELSLYLAVRRFIPISVLQQVEYGQIKPSGTIEEPEVIKRKSSKSTKKES